MRELIHNRNNTYNVGHTTTRTHTRRASYFFQVCDKQFGPLQLASRAIYNLHKIWFGAGARVRRFALEHVCPFRVLFFNLFNGLSISLLGSLSLSLSERYSEPLYTFPFIVPLLKPNPKETKGFLVRLLLVIAQPTQLRASLTLFPLRTFASGCH